MSSYSTSDLSRKSGDIIAEALRHPVTITQRSKPRLVLMNIEDYEKLIRAADPRRVYRTDQVPDEIRDLLLPALDEILEGKDDDGP
ncbi:type II toxin-antitoxin system prevent-host-death family antitoxin [Inquilinus limosus]|uniref:type II toxin-antitoxin system prevent-host-death family antitoxin n=1 Tax=Inquilinus limosus TaxID=171674 RepID=UPI003F154CA6